MGSDYSQTAGRHEKCIKLAGLHVLSAQASFSSQHKWGLGWFIQLSGIDYENILAGFVLGQGLDNEII